MPSKKIHNLSVIYLRHNTAWCGRCRATVRIVPALTTGSLGNCRGKIRSPLSHFMITKDSDARVGVCGWCGPVVLTAKGSCQNARDQTAYYRREGSHGLTIAQARAMRAGKTCEICNGPAQAVDHDHTTGRVRGVLCSACNRGIGLFEDNPELLAAAIDYLIRTKAVISSAE